jgi:hypothetical protein
MPIRHNTFERPDDIGEELKPGEGYYFDVNKRLCAGRARLRQNAWRRCHIAHAPLRFNVRIKKTTARVQSASTFSFTARAWKPTGYVCRDAARRFAPTTVRSNRRRTIISIKPCSRQSISVFL